ncbi:MAG: molybdenum cofactor biosynthesis protein MoaE [Methylococcaceae bacterium]|nr:molybdenum cofactor biosynthesis protein MoaE [Methylococcaceae bacterium]
MPIKLCEQAFNPWKEIEAYQTQTAELAGKHGATAVFVGTMRDFNQGDGVRSMFLEHYPGMTEKQLQHIVEQAERQWSLLDTLVLHRIGAVNPDDTLVLVAAWAVHRGDAFDACRFIMEALKSRAPFWKKETLVSGQARWVENNSKGYQSK